MFPYYTSIDFYGISILPIILSTSAPLSAMFYVIYCFSLVSFFLLANPILFFCILFNIIISTPLSSLQLQTILLIPIIFFLMPVSYVIYHSSYIPIIITFYIINTLLKILISIHIQSLSPKVICFLIIPYSVILFYLNIYFVLITFFVNLYIFLFVIFLFLFLPQISCPRCSSRH